MHSVRIVPLRPRHFSSYRPIATHRVQLHHQSRRCVHQLRQLPYDVDQGLGNFLSPAALRMICIDYQQGLLARLNEQVKGTHMEGLSVTDTVISAASHERNALAFNYASQALNNSFFLECLRPPPPPPATNEDNMVTTGATLLGDIRVQFGSLAQLQSTFSAAAMGMVNSGWVWLVSDEHGQMEVVATFGAGTLLVRSRTHMRTSDLPILGEPLESRYRGLTVRPKQEEQQNVEQTLHSHVAPPATSTAYGYAQGTSPSTPPNIYDSRAMTPTGQATEQDKSDVIGDILTPLLCVSVQEHAWVGGGYGVWGKEEYLKQFWTVVNWERVAVARGKARQLA
ncbi:Manganese/iron superoxide dismutase [Gautieria morchelliformis]|nr:Manganese/iron superoxide dismutase [Gautieria morchelliformis]